MIIYGLVALCSWLCPQPSRPCLAATTSCSILQPFLSLICTQPAGSPEHCWDAASSGPDTIHSPVAHRARSASSVEPGALVCIKQGSHLKTDWTAVSSDLPEMQVSCGWQRKPSVSALLTSLGVVLNVLSRKFDTLGPRREWMIWYSSFFLQKRV